MNKIKLKQFKGNFGMVNTHWVHPQFPNIAFGVHYYGYGAGGICDVSVISTKTTKRIQRAQREFMHLDNRFSLKEFRTTNDKTEASENVLACLVRWSEYENQGE